MQEPRQKKVLCTCTVCTGTWKPIFQCYTNMYTFIMVLVFYMYFCSYTFKIQQTLLELFD